MTGRVLNGGVTFSDRIDRIGRASTNSIIPSSERMFFLSGKAHHAASTKLAFATSFFSKAAR